MLNSLYVPTRSEEERAKIHELITEILAEEDTFTNLSEEEAIGEINGRALVEGITLSKAQITGIWDAKTKVAQEIEDHILKNEGKKLNPKVKLALQLSLALAAAYWTPELFAIMTGKEMLKKLMTPMIGEKNINLAETGVMLTTGYLGYRYSPMSLVQEALPGSLANLNMALRFPLVYLPSLMMLSSATTPFATLAAKTGQAITKHVPGVLDSANDFFELMNGQGDEERIAEIREAHKGAWAAKNVDELLSDITSGISWLWKKATTKTTVAPQVTTPLEPQQGQALPNPMG